MPSFQRNLLTFFSITRVQNGLLVVVAQYLSAIFILGREKSVRLLLQNLELHMIVLASFLVVSSGYLINQYYDHPKDLINRPIKTVIDGQWRLSSIMRMYLTLNFLAFLVASSVSLRAALYFVGYITTIWLYSHRIRTLFLWGSLLSAFLAVSPIAALFLYYRHVEPLILGFAGFLFLLLLALVQIKDLHNLRGDISAGFKTIPIVLGESKTRMILRLIFSCLSLISIALPLVFDLGLMAYYFWASLPFFVFLAIDLWINRSSLSYIKMRMLLKIWVLLGTLSILFLDFERLNQLKALIFTP